MKNIKNIKNILEQIAISSPSGKNSDLLIQLAGQLRPSRRKSGEAADAFNQLISILNEQDNLRISLKSYIHRITSGQSFVKLFTEVGIMSNEGFLTDILRIAGHVILPPVENKQDPINLIGRLFHHTGDYKWVSAISNDQWSRFFQLMELKPVSQLERQTPIVKDLTQSIKIISHRIAAIGLEPVLVNKLPELQRLKSPYLVQNNEINELIKDINKEGYFSDADYRHILVMLSQCEEYAERIRRNKSRFGTSISLTNLMLRLKQNIMRIRRLLDLFKTEDNEIYMEREIIFLKDLVKLENKKSDILGHITSNLSLLTYQITEHKSATAEHYITHSGRDYFRLFVSALGGGFIVAFFCVFKVEISQWNLSYFGQAVLYSLNYASGFILIYVTHSTLATKHPAMTAAHIVKSLDQHSSMKPQHISLLIIKVIRSQFAAFMGNIIMAIIMTYLLIKLANFTDHQLSVDPEKAKKLLIDVSPIHSLAVIHAALTGICLFLSGIIAGYVDNISHYHNLEPRIKKHPLLRKIMPARKKIAFARYIDKHLGNLTGNFMLGVFLGSMAAIGGIFGLPLDVRHITFSSGNFGIALSTLSGLDLMVILISVSGILIIGLMNFTFSFGPALYIAFKSREVNLKQVRKAHLILLKHLLKDPLGLVFPTSKSKTEGNFSSNGK